MWGQPRNPFGGYVFPDTAPPIVPPMAAAVQARPQGHGFLREGGPGRTILGILADVLAGASGGTPMFAQNMAQKRQLQMQDMRETMKAQREAMAPIRDKIGDDYVEIDPLTKKATVLYHGQSTKAPYRWETNDGSLAELGPDGQARIVYKDPTPKVDYIQAKDPVTGAISLIPRTVGSAAASPAPATTKEQYDALPPGAPYIAPDGSHRVKGGPTPQASGTFR